MGVVYRARDSRLERAVAIKALPTELASDPARLERFEREAKTLAQLNHPNIAGIHGLEEHDGQRFLVLEFVEGETLADRLDRGPLAVDEAVELAAQIAAGVGAAHDSSVIHRDLKPGNIMITPEGQAKVLDFGLARADDGTSSSGSGLSQSPTMTSPARHQHSPTIPGAILGTAAYMSPEQARGRRVDKRTDVWSFGVVLYEMLVGTSPFVGETAGDSIGAVLHKSFDLGHLPEGTPASVRRVLGRCLQRNKELRYRDIGDARLELLSGSVDSPDPDRKVASGPRAGPFAIGAALLALVGGLILGREVLAPSAPPPETLHVAIPMDDPFIEYGPNGTFFDIDPEGRVLAYVETEPGPEGERRSSAIYLRKLGEAESYRLPGTEHARKVSFDPTGQHLAFSYQPPDGSEWELRRIAIDGRAPSTVFVDPRRFDLGSPAVWLGPDRLVVPGDDGLSVHVVNANGGFPTEVAQLNDRIEGAIFIMDMWSPGKGDLVYVSVYRQGPGSAQGVDVHELNVVTGDLRLLLPEAAYFRVVRGGYALFIRNLSMTVARWDPDAREIVGVPVPTMARPSGSPVVRISPAGTLAMAVFPTTDEQFRVMSVTRDGAVTPVTSQRRKYGGHVIVSPDGSRLALTMWGDELEPKVYVLDLDTGYLQQVGDGKVAVAPHWLPDGRFVYSQINNLTDQVHFVVDLDAGAQPERLFDTEESLGLAVESGFTRDGRVAIVNVMDPVTAEGDIYALDMQTLERTPLVVSAADNRQGRLSADERLLSYVTGDGGVMRVMVRAFDRETLTVGPPVPVSGEVPWPAIWSPAGTELFMVDETYRNFMVAKVEYPEDAAFGAFTVGRPQVLFTREDADWQKDWSDFPIGVSPDAQTFYYVENRDSPEAPRHVRLILNWDVELERLLQGD